MTLAELQHNYVEKQNAFNSLNGRTLAAAERDRREISPEENHAIAKALLEAQNAERRLRAAQSDQSALNALDAMTAGAAMTVTAPRGSGRTLGAQIVGSAAYKWFQQNKGTFGNGQWFSPMVELPGVGLFATTIDEGSSGVGGGRLIIADVQPTVSGSTPQPTVAQLCASGQASGTHVQVTVEKAFTNAAAPVLEAGVKPESALDYETLQPPIEKIAHWLPVTEEAAADIPQLTSQIDSRLRDGVLDALDNQILNGNGVSPQLAGFLTRTNLAPTVVVGAAPDNAIDAIARQIGNIESATSKRVSGIALHPDDWNAMSVKKDTTGRYLGAGPFDPTTTNTLWRRTVATTSHIPKGTALVGCFATMAQVFYRGYLNVQFSNSHQDFFIKNLIAVRAEQRAALVIYRESCFGKVTGL